MATDLIRLMHALFLPGAEVGSKGVWQPPTDVYQTPDGWLIKFDLAGVRPEDVELSIEGSRLTVRGSRRDWSVEEGCRHYLMEIAYSKFERSIVLPTDLSTARFTTEYRYGLLLIRIRLEGVK